MNTFSQFEENWNCFLIIDSVQKHRHTITITVDVVGYRSSNNYGFLVNSSTEKLLEYDELNLQEAKELKEGNFQPQLRDEIFPLKSWLIRRSIGRGLTEAESMYNCHHLGALRTIENPFGIHTAR